MRAKLALALLVVGAVLATGCVERKMLIRSAPPGAPVWIDEEYVGLTPLEHPFAHYGSRRIRVGPIRDEREKLQYMEKERVVDVEPPWYEKFPIDFFFEVIYPKQLTDEHELNVFVLDPVEERPEPQDEDRVRRLRQEAQEFRKKALLSIPEAPAK